MDPKSGEAFIEDTRRAALRICRGQTWMCETASVEIIDERPIGDLYACFVRITAADGTVERSALPLQYLVHDFVLRPNVDELKSMGR